MIAQDGRAIIDAHTHILPESFRRERATYALRDNTFAALIAPAKTRIATGDELVASMNSAGIDRSVALGYGWTDIEVARESNNYLLDQAEAFSGRIIPFCSVNPAWGDAALDEIRRCEERGAKGIGELHPDSQGYRLSDTNKLRPMMSLAFELGLIVLTHSSEPVGHAYAGKGTATPSELEAFLMAFPENNIVFAHFGGGLPFYALMPEVKRALGNCYFDTAAAPFLYDTDIYGQLHALIGHNLIFGSDFPLVPQERALMHLADGGEIAIASSGGAATLLGLES